MSDLDDEDRAQIAARKKDSAEALPKLKEILGKRTKYPETLEGMFGVEKAARMRREAEILALRDGLKD